MSIPVVQEERAQRRSAFAAPAVSKETPAQQSPFLPFALLLLYVILVYLRPFEYLQYAETFRGVPLLPVLMGFMLLAWLPVQGKRFDAPQYPLMLGLLVCIPISIISGTRWFGGALDAFIGFIPVVVLFVITATLVNSPRRLRQMFFVLGAVSAVIAWHGIDQVRDGVGWSGAPLFQERITYVGFLGDPNDLAMALLIALPMTLSFLRREGSKFLGLAALTASAMIIYGLYLTNSRGAMLALAAMIALYSLLRHGWQRSMFVVPILLAALIYASPSRVNDILAEDESASNRVEYWYEGFDILKRYPLLGVGKGQFMEHNSNRTAHNSFVLAVAELGMIGYFFWLSLVATAAVLLVALLRAPPPETSSGSPQQCAYGEDSWTEHQRLARILLYALTGCLVSAFFLSRTYVILLYLLLAMIVGLYQSSRVRWPHVPSFNLRSRFGQLVLLEIGSLAFLWLTTRILLSSN